MTFATGFAWSIGSRRRTGNRNTRSYKGATFNLAHNLGQMLTGRPRNRFEELDGVYLTGGGTHPGSGLPVIYESSRISSRLLLQDHGINTDFIDHDSVGSEAKDLRSLSVAICVGRCL